jgi:kinesin family member 22
MSLASKPETPKVKVDMEAKLRAWLESKGKTKSIQRMNGIFSPTASKTPSSISQMKQPASSRIFSRAKAMDHDGVKIKKCVSSFTLIDNMESILFLFICLLLHRILFDPDVRVSDENQPRASTQNVLNVNKSTFLRCSSAL